MASPRRPGVGSRLRPAWAVVRQLENGFGVLGGHIAQAGVFPACCVLGASAQVWPWLTRGRWCLSTVSSCGEVINLQPNPQRPAPSGLDFSPPLWWRGPVFTPLCRSVSRSKGIRILLQLYNKTLLLSVTLDLKIVNLKNGTSLLGDQVNPLVKFSTCSPAGLG